MSIRPQLPQAQGLDANIEAIAIAFPFPVLMREQEFSINYRLLST
jgi:hypothetical protein